MSEIFRREREVEESWPKDFRELMTAERKIDRLLDDLDAIERNGWDRQQWQAKVEQINAAYDESDIAFDAYVKEREMDKAAYEKHLEQKAEADRISAEYEAER